MTNLESYRGDTFGMTLQFNSVTGCCDITGWTIWFTLKTSLDDVDSSALLTKTLTSHYSPTSGTSSINLSNVETNSLAGTYVYDVQYKDLTGNVKTAMAGNFKFLKDVTRSYA